MNNFLTRIFNPAFFHGRGSREKFFEGWFYKITDKTKNISLAIIPGIYLSSDHKKSHCFIQIVDGINNKVFYQKFPVETFTANDNYFKFKIMRNVFSLDRIAIKEFQSGEDTIKIDFELNSVVKWKSRLTTPNIMGWYTYVPLMECKHALLAFSGSIKGVLSINESVVYLENAKLYVEKDWGSSFPVAYIWAQSNNFANANASFMISIAKIPWLKKSFTGLLAVLYDGNKTYNLSTYKGGLVTNLKVEPNSVNITVKTSIYTLTIEIERNEGVVLHGPIEGEMIKGISESLNSKLKIKLESKSGTIFEDTGIFSGLDINGDINEILPK